MGLCDSSASEPKKTDEKPVKSPAKDAAKAVVGGKGGLPPKWTTGEMEAPAGTKDMGSWTATVFTEEQQKRLGVDELGKKIEGALDGVKLELGGDATLYVLAVSANSHGSMALIKANDLPVKTRVMNFPPPETREEWFVAKNPWHVCPTYEEEGSEAIWESNNLLRFLCNKHKLSKWYPEEPRERAKVDQALDYRQTNLYPKVGKACYPLLGFSQDHESQPKGQEEVLEACKLLESFYLKKGKFACDFDHPTIADLSIRSALSFCEVLPVSLPAAIEAYCKRVDEAVPAYVEVRQPLDGYLAYLASQKQEEKKEEAPKKAKGKKTASKKSATLDDDTVALKEGRTLGQDLAKSFKSSGKAFHHVSLDKCKGDLDLMQAAMNGCNESKARELGIMFFSTNASRVAYVCQVPDKLKQKVDLGEWCDVVGKACGGKCLHSENNLFKGEAVAASEAEANEKRDAAISAGAKWVEDKLKAADKPAGGKKGGSKKKSGKKKKNKNKKGGGGGGGGDGGKKEAPKEDDDKLKKAALKEGGKKGQDISGLADMGGVRFFTVTCDAALGRMDLLEVCLEGFNKEVDPEAEDRKGGAGGLAKMLFSHNDTTLSIIVHLPKALQDKLALQEWADTAIAALEPMKMKVLGQTDEVIKLEGKTDIDAGVYAHKKKDECIGQVYHFLTQKSLVMADDSDDEDIVYGDDDMPDYL